MNFNNLKRTFVVAEIGINHEGDEVAAEDMIRKAADAGADAVKFQTYESESYISLEQPERLARVKRFELSRTAFERLAKVAKDCGVIFFSTPLSIGDVGFVSGISSLIKVASGEITWLDLVRKIAKTDKPMIISTGIATEQEIEFAIEAVVSERPSALNDGSLMLMHCVSSYPTPPEDANILNVGWLRQRFGLPVGYSDHTLGIKACELAIAAGAVAIEKHFTYRKEDQNFHDHALSANPSDMKALVEKIRVAEIYLGKAQRTRSDAEAKGEANMRRSLAAAVDIPKFTNVTEHYLTALRPAWGLGPNDADKVLGKRLNRDVRAGEIIRAEDIDE
jgi:sialic acid synthase SpsE